jgi:hypothetical protein
MKRIFTNKRLAATTISAMASLFIVASPATPVAATTLTMSGTITAGGAPIPAGTMQVAFVQYPTSTACGGLSGTVGVAMVGANGTFSHNLDFSIPSSYRVVFRPMSTAPRTSLWRLFKAGTPAGVTQFAMSSCLAQSGGSRNDINLATSVEGVNLSGTLSTSSGSAVATTSSIVLSRSVNNYLTHGDGYIVRVSDSGIWDLSGVDKSQPNLYMQVNVGGVIYSVKRVGSNYEVIPYDSTCGDACKFPIGTTDISSINLKLPVTGLISGTISGPDGPVGQSQVCAVVYKDGGSAMNMYSLEAGRSCTNASGEYSLGVTYGSYRLQFQNNGSAPFKSEWFDNVSNASGYSGATVITLGTTGNLTPTRTINPVIEEGKYIRGRITDSDGQNVSGASVSAMLVSPETSMTIGVGGTQTGSDGSYSLAGLEAGTYMLMASHPDYGMLYLGGSRDNATQITITSNSPGSTDRNISFPRGYALEGSISTGDNSEARICAAAYRTSESAMGWGEFVSSNCFTAPGPWRLKGLKSGSYRVRFDAQTGNLRSVFLGGTTDFNNATITEITTADISNVNVTIPAGKSISGKIVNTDPSPVQSACVSAFKQDDSGWGYGMWAGSSCTSTTGEYVIRGLEDGIYRLRIESPMNSDYSPGFHSSGGTPVKSADDAQLFTLGNSVANLNQTLMTGPKFTGTIKDGATPVSQVCVNAFKKAGSFGWGEWSGSSCSGNDGKISLRGLSAGDYTFEVRPNAGSYQSGWYVQNSTTNQNSSSATLRTIATANVDLGDILLISGKKATGRIVNSDGNPVSGVCIGALKDSPFGWGEWAGSACTQNDGKFTVRGLDPSASYRFRADVWTGDYKPGFITSSGNSITPDFTTVNAVSAANDITLGDVTIATGPSISGTVTSGTNEPEANVCVSAHDPVTLMWKASSCSQSNGKFSLRGLDVGDYKLSWWSQKPLLTNGWYRETSSGPTQATNSADADPLALPSSGISNLSIRMANGGKLFGSVTGSTSRDLCVAAWTEPSSGTRDNAAATACVNDELKFELKGLTPNTNYYLQIFKKGTDGSPITQNSPSTDTPLQTGGSAITISVS